MKKVTYYLVAICVVLLVSATIVDATVIKSLPYEITTRGYYTINTNFTSAGHGIIVKVNNVTIDLKGYTIEGKGTGSYNGIYMNGRNNVEIRNGTIRNFGSYGIFEENSTSGHSHRVINVRVMNNGVGIYLRGSNHMVKDCTVSNSGGLGIYAADGSTISGNNAYNNVSYGIYAGTGSTVNGNASYNSGSHGIYAVYGCTVSGNASYSNGASGISVFYGSTVKNNAAYFNQQYGIELAGSDLVDGNTAYSNNKSGGSYTNISTCGSCVFGDNVQ
jgi:parallel beta-helix repeat protein